MTKVKKVRSLTFLQGTALNILKSSILFILLWLIFHEVLTTGELVSMQFITAIIFGPLQDLGTIIVSYREVEASLLNFDQLMQKHVEERPENPVARAPRPSSWILLPGNARRQWRDLLGRQQEMTAWSEDCRWNRLTLNPDDRELGVVTTGLARNYFEENAGELARRPSHLHVGAYPPPLALLHRLAGHVQRLLVLEDFAYFTYDDGRPRDWVSTVSVRREGKSLVIDVKDRGIGVPAAERERIFREFYRVDESLSAPVRGSGLGLTIARRILRDLGGDVVHVPREGGGSVFRITLPEAVTP